MVPAIKGTSNRTISCELHLYLRLDWPPVKSIILVFNQYIIKFADPTHKNTGYGLYPQEKNRIELQTGSDLVKLHSLIFSLILHSTYLRYFFLQIINRKGSVAIDFIGSFFWIRVFRLNPCLEPSWSKTWSGFNHYTLIRIRNPAYYTQTALEPHNRLKKLSKSVQMNSIM